MKKTKIICTLGPAVDAPQVLEKLILAGMDVARINFSHGNYQDQAPRIENFKQVREKVGKPVALMLDTKGPEIRIGKFENGEAFLQQGETFTLCYDEILGDNSKVSVSYKNLYNEVTPGIVILINDGLIKVAVKEIQGKNVICEVVDGGKLTNTKSINIPGSSINLPSPTEKDIEDIKFGITAGFDYIAASFVRTPEDILGIKKILTENGGEHIKIIAKIENRQGIDNFDSILEIADGIMVARGDLGVEIPMEEVPIRQKEFIAKCTKVGKPVIIATQMLESMVNSPRPTRAEVSDVANAVYDMTSSIMLSGESAMGKYPVECVQTMVKICEAIENSIQYWEKFETKERNCDNADYEYNLNYSTCATAKDLCAKAIFAYTNTGRTAKMLAGFMPECPIYVITSNQEVYKQLSLIWNTHSILVEPKESIDDMIDSGIQKAKENGYIVEGDTVVISGGASILDGYHDTKLNKTIGGVLKV